MLNRTEKIVLTTSAIIAAAIPAIAFIKAVRGPRVETQMERINRIADSVITNPSN